MPCRGLSTAHSCPAPAIQGRAPQLLLLLTKHRRRPADQLECPQHMPRDMAKPLGVAARGLLAPGSGLNRKAQQQSAADRACCLERAVLKNKRRWLCSSRYTVLVSLGLITQRTQGLRIRTRSTPVHKHARIITKQSARRQVPATWQHLVHQPPHSRQQRAHRDYPGQREVSAHSPSLSGDSCSLAPGVLRPGNHGVFSEIGNNSPAHKSGKHDASHDSRAECWCKTCARAQG